MSVPPYAVPPYGASGSSQSNLGSQQPSGGGSGYLQVTGQSSQPLSHSSPHLGAGSASPTGTPHAQAYGAHSPAGYRHSDPRALNVHSAQLHAAVTSRPASAPYARRAQSSGGFDGKQSIMTQQRHQKEHETNRLHAKTYGAWVNSVLQHEGCRIDNMKKDFADGIIIIKLVEVLSNTKCKDRYNSKPASDMHKLDNLVIAMRYCNQFVEVTSLDPKEILRGNLKTILALIWRLISQFRIISCANPDPKSSTERVDERNMASRSREARHKLLEWVRAQTTGYPAVNVVDFETSFNDGLAFCALVHKFNPSLIDYNQVTRENHAKNLQMAFVAAAENMNIPILLDPADMCNPDPSLRPDERCVMTYVSHFPFAYLRKMQSMSASSAPKPAVVQQPTVVQPSPPPAMQQPMLQQGSFSSGSFSGASPAMTRSAPPTTASNALPSGKVGILAIQVVKARGLMVRDRLSGKSDPYVRISLERQREQTRKVKKNLNPVWNADFKFYASDPNGIIHVEVFDWDRFLSDDFLGQIDIPISSVPINVPQDRWFTLTPKKKNGKVSGEIHLKYTLSLQ